jgi:hypothetical protein
MKNPPEWRVCVRIAGMTWLLAVVLRPIGALVLFGLIALPLRLLFQRWYPEGKVKRFLLRELKSSRRAGRA